MAMQQLSDLVENITSPLKLQVGFHMAMRAFTCQVLLKCGLCSSTVGASAAEASPDASQD